MPFILVFSERVVMISVAIGIINRRIEYAVLFSLVLAAILMFFLWTV